MEYKYRDKVYLSNYMLDTELFDNFDFKVEDAAPIRSIYILTTDSGMKILKKVDYSLNELMFIYDSLNVVREKYPYVINFRKSIFGKPYIEYQGGVYVVLDLIEGRECVFENPIDLSQASKALSKLHKAGESLDIYYNKRNNLGKIIEKFNIRANDLKVFKDIASMHINKSEFDKLYLDYADYYISCIEKTVKHLNSSVYSVLSLVKHTLCHHDLAHHNIIIGNDNNVYFIDFDYSIIDVPYHDISNIITKAIKHGGWDIEIANIVMDAYMEDNKLSKEEINVLYGFLMFPHDFYEIAMNYYRRTRDWDEDDFADKLKRKAEYKDEREKFLNEFKNKWLE